MMNRITLTGAALAVLGTVAWAGGDLKGMDEDGDGRISRNEYESHVSEINVLESRDTNTDGIIDESEYDVIGFDADFDAWDVNEDSYLDRDEFRDGIFSTYDANNDGYWESDEFDDVNEAGIFDI